MGRMARSWATPIAAAVMIWLATPIASFAQEDGAAADQGPVGFTVEGIIRSTRGGIGFPGGQVMRAPPRLETGGAYECAPPAGESRSCAIGGRWDYCALSSIAFSQADPFAEPRCTVVDRGEGLWSIDVVSTRRMVISCMATCFQLVVR